MFPSFILCLATTLYTEDVQYGRGLQDIFNVLKQKTTGCDLDPIRNRKYSITLENLKKIRRGITYEGIF